MAAEGGNIVRFTYTGTDDEIPFEATHIFVLAKVVPEGEFNSHPNIVEVICHEDVDQIKRSAFLRCPSLRRVIMPGVKIVEKMAFHHCDALEYVECDKLESIDLWAFSWCISLRSINLPSIRFVGPEVLCRCHALTDVKFGSKLEEMWEGTFWLNNSLEQITIPLKDNLITHDNIFQGCDNLHHVHLVEGGLHETIAALHLEEWRNDMNDEIDSINQILPNAPSGGWEDNDDDDEEGDPGENAQAIRGWIRSVIQRLNHYKAEHRKLLMEATSLLELALWKANLRDNNRCEGEREGVRTTRGSRKRARKEICVTSGADVVIKNVLPFLQLPEQDDDSI